MAKSQKKSKWLRKFRAIKREKNKAKELLMLNKCLASAKKNEEEMADATKLPIMIDGKTISI